MAPLCGALHAVAGVPPAGAARRAAAVAAVRRRDRLALALGGVPALAATINVGGACTLLQAIRAANTDTAKGGCPAGSGADTLVLPVGSTQTLTAVQDTAYGPSGVPVISSPITIAGNGSTIQRDEDAPAFRIITVNFVGELTLQETTIRGGVASGDAFAAADGGGVFNYGTLTLTDSTISGNSAAGSGGGVLSRGPLTLTHSTISGNSARSGGGVQNYYTLTLTDSTISGNSASDRRRRRGESLRHPHPDPQHHLRQFRQRLGGGVANNGTLTLTHSTISGNSASSSAAAWGMARGTSP